MRGGATYDQTWIPLSSVLQMMCISFSVNLMMHLFCNFSTVWMMSFDAYVRVISS